jgi:hypothetical protein
MRLRISVSRGVSAAVADEAAGRVRPVPGADLILLSIRRAMDGLIGDPPDRILTMASTMSVSAAYL